MTIFQPHLLALPFLIVCTEIARTDEAVEPTGKRHPGRLLLEKDAWLFRTDAGKQIALDQLAFVRFEAKSPPLPKAPLTATLLLPHEQRVTGTFLSVDAKDVVFTTSWGKILTLDRGQVVGVEQANDALVFVRDDFETTLAAWQVEGRPALSQDRAFFGKSSLRFDAAGQSATRVWKAVPRDGAIRLFFFDAGGANPLQWSCSVLIDGKKPPPSFVVVVGGYTCANVDQAFAAQKSTPGWHLLAIEVADGRVRVFVDDVCLGQTRLSGKDAIAGIRCAVASAKDAGALWIDELVVTRRLPSVTKPRTSDEQDSVLLEHGEQLFGRIAAADGENVVLDAKFGKRTFSWTRLRGIQFAPEGEVPGGAEPEVTFRPGPGSAVDRLRAKLLRWEQENLVVEHPVLGQITVERDRIDRIRPVRK